MKTEVSIIGATTEGAASGPRYREYHTERPRRLPRSRENPSQTEKAMGMNCPGENDAPESTRSGRLKMTDHSPWSYLATPVTSPVSFAAMSPLPFARNRRGAGRARSKNQRSTEFCESPKMKYGLRAPVGTCEGIWTATASENSDAWAAGAASSSNGFFGGCCALGAGCAWPAGVGAASAPPQTLSAPPAFAEAPACAEVTAAGGGPASSSSSRGTGSDGPFFPVFSALMSCH